MDKKTQLNIWYVILAIFGVIFLQNLWIREPEDRAPSVQRFRAEAQGR